MSSYSILLVDDEELALVGLLKGLSWEKIGFSEVLTANNMKEAIEILENHSCQVMLSDIEMPGGSGLDLIRHVRQDYPEIVCLFYTAYPDFNYCQEALKLGALPVLLLLYCFFPVLLQQKTACWQMDTFLFQESSAQPHMNICWQMEAFSMLI